MNQKEITYKLEVFVGWLKINWEVMGGERHHFLWLTNRYVVSKDVVKKMVTLAKVWTLRAEQN